MKFVGKPSLQEQNEPGKQWAVPPVFEPFQGVIWQEPISEGGRNHEKQTIFLAFQHLTLRSFPDFARLFMYP
jgi:hypothetical protein